MYLFPAARAADPLLVTGRQRLAKVGRARTARPGFRAGAASSRLLLAMGADRPQVPLEPGEARCHQGRADGIGGAECCRSAKAAERRLLSAVAHDLPQLDHHMSSPSPCLTVVGCRQRLRLLAENRRDSNLKSPVKSSVRKPCWRDT
jgi:hypothetical protein